MADRGFGERQHAVDPYGADTTGARFGERPLDVGEARPRARDDALQAVVERAEVELDLTAGVRTRGDETSAEGEAAERLRPERAVADVLEHDVDAAPLGDAQDRLEEVLATVVHRDVRAALARGSRALVGARGGDDVRADELRDLHHEPAERARRTHHQRPLARAQLGAPREREGERRVTDHDRRLREREALRHRVNVLGRHAHVLGVAAPAMDADLPLPVAVLALAGAARLARPAGDRVMDHHAVAALPDVHTIAHRLDRPGGIDAQDARERQPREGLAAPDP